MKSSSEVAGQTGRWTQDLPGQAGRNDSSAAMSAQPHQRLRRSALFLDDQAMQEVSGKAANVIRMTHASGYNDIDLTLSL